MKKENKIKVYKNVITGLRYMRSDTMQRFRNKQRRARLVLNEVGRVLDK